MHNFDFWNVQGLHKENKQKEPRSFVLENKVGLFRVLETRVKKPKMGLVVSNTFEGWCFTSKHQLVKERENLVSLAASYKAPDWEVLLFHSYLWVQQ